MPDEDLTGALASGQEPAPVANGDAAQTLWNEMEEGERDTGDGKSTPSEIVVQGEEGAASTTAATTPAASTEASEGAETVDPWEQAPEELRNAYQGVTSQFDQYRSTMGGRVAALQRRLNEAERKLAAQPERPAEQANPLTDPKFAKFKEDYPDIAEPMEAIVGSLMAENASLKQTYKSVESEVSHIATERHVNGQIDLLAQEHPDWQQVIADKSFAEWAMAQPEYLKEVIRRNGSNVVDASEAASIITSFKLQTGIPLTRAEAAATPTPRAPAASARRAAQIESAAAPRGNGVAGAVVQGIPAEGDPQAIWDAFEREEQRKRQQPQ